MTYSDLSPRVDQDGVVAEALEERIEVRCAPCMVVRGLDREDRRLSLLDRVPLPGPHKSPCCLTGIDDVCKLVEVE